MIKPDCIDEEVRRALAEDVGRGDVSAALLPKDLMVQAKLISREPMVVCGIPWVSASFHALDSGVQMHWLVQEGEKLKEGRVLCTLSGPARAILTAERTALNFFQTLSATATQTHRYVSAMNSPNTRLLDTRKTLPGLRQAQKYAVRCGGGVNHRMGLFDAYLIKENHIRAFGSLTRAVAAAREQNDGLFIEVEVEDLAQCQEALLTHPDRILLDNFSLDMLKAAVILNQPYVCDLEASGGITIQNIASVAQTGVDCISVGDLTKSLNAIDLSLLVEL